MAILAKEGEKKEFFLAPAGTVQAVCYDVWDLGFQKTSYQGKEKIQHKIIIAWEIAELIPSGEYQGRRFAVSKRYTLSLYDKAALCADLVSWRGRAFTDDEKKGFDIETLIGVNCLLGIIHNRQDDKTYANVGTVSPLMKGMTKMVPENERATPEWVKKIQANQVDPEILHAPKENEPADTEIPF